MSTWLVNHHLHFIPKLEQLIGVFQVLEAQVGNVDQPLETIDVDERAKGLQARDFAFEDLPRGVFLLGSGPRVLHQGLAAEPDLTAFVDLGDLHFQFITGLVQLVQHGSSVVAGLADVDQAFQILHVG